MRDTVEESLDHIQFLARTMQGRDISYIALVMLLELAPAQAADAALRHGQTAAALFRRNQGLCAGVRQFHHPGRN